MSEDTNLENWSWTERWSRLDMTHLSSQRRCSRRSQTNRRMTRRRVRPTRRGTGPGTGEPAPAQL